MMLAEASRRAPPPAQFVGQARQLRARIAAEDRAVVAAMKRAAEPIIDRLEKHPHRDMRRELVSDFIRAWRRMPSLGRIWLDVHPHGGKGVTIHDHRLLACGTTLESWREGLDAVPEPGLLVVTVTSIVRTGALERRKLVRGSIGLHALARFYERALHASPVRAVESCFALVECIPEDVTKPDGTFSIPTGDRGAWLGVAARDRETGGPSLAVRTFWSDR